MLSAYSRIKAVAFNTRHTPVIMAIVNYIHVVCLLCGHRGPVAEAAAGIGILPALYMLINEWGYGFCWLHKALVTYSVLVYACIYVQRLVGFGHFLIYAHMVVFALGSWLLITLAINFKAYEKDNRSCRCKNR